MNVQPSIARATDELLVQPMSDCDWPTTNCYIDVWTLILNSWQLDPIAGLGFTVAQDYEGDQFTFFKYQHDDLEQRDEQGLEQVGRVRETVPQFDAAAREPQSYRVHCSYSFTRAM